MLNIRYLNLRPSLENSATAITYKTIPFTSNATRYNLNGQKVSAAFKGMVIIDGKKVIQK